MFIVGLLRLGLGMLSSPCVPVSCHIPCDVSGSVSKGVLVTSVIAFGAVVFRWVVIARNEGSDRILSLIIVGVVQAIPSHRIAPANWQSPKFVLRAHLGTGSLRVQSHLARRRFRLAIPNLRVRCPRLRLSWGRRVAPIRALVVAALPGSVVPAQGPGDHLERSVHMRDRFQALAIHSQFIKREEWLGLNASAAVVTTDIRGGELQSVRVPNVFANELRNHIAPRFDVVLQAAQLVFVAICRVRRSSLVIVFADFMATPCHFRRSLL